MKKKKKRNPKKTVMHSAICTYTVDAVINVTIVFDVTGISGWTWDSLGKLTSMNIAISLTRT